jgi:hypothetical protein
MLTVIDAKTRAHRFTRQYSMPGGALRALVLLESDAHGVVYLGAAMTSSDLVQIICVDALDGHPLGVTQVPSNRSADETFREFAVSDDGQIVALVRSEEGAQLRSYECP